MPASAILLTFARRGEDETILSALAVLKQTAPEVVAIGTSVSAPVLRNLGLTDVITMGEDASTRGALAQARARRPRVAAVVYGGASFAGHLKLEALALLIGAPSLLRVRPEQPVQRVGRLRLALGVAAKTLQAAGCYAIGAFVCGIAWCWLRVAGGRHASRT